MKKKNPFVTTIGFKKDNPEHVYVAELLNSMERGKAQYIVRAVMVYQELQEHGEVLQPLSTVFGYEQIKKVVLQVIEERECHLGYPVAEYDAKEILQQVRNKDEDMIIGLDNNAISGILDSLAAFQEQ